jgi:hypothetical protein
MKSKLEFIKCNGCGICIGPKFETRNFLEVGPNYLCPDCAMSLKEEGFLYIEETSKHFHYVMFKDGLIKRLSLEELQKLQKH